MYELLNLRGFSAWGINLLSLFHGLENYSILINTPPTVIWFIDAQFCFQAKNPLGILLNNTLKSFMTCKFMIQ